MTAAVRRLDPWPLLRGAPIALPQLLAVVALVILSAPEGGFPLEDWAPGGVLLSLLLLVALLALPLVGRRPHGSRLAILCLVGFAVWTAASLLWADDRGAVAIAGARTGLLAVTFVLFARWRQRPQSALAVATALTIGLGALAWSVIVRLHGAPNLDAWFLYDRLLEPVGYVNAGAAFWAIAAFLGTGLLGGALPAWQRVAGALVAVPSAALSLLCLSRGGLLATAIVVVLLLALLPGRARHATAFLIVGLGLAVGLPALLDVGHVLPTAYLTHIDTRATLRGALDRVIVGTVLAVVLTALWAALERLVPAPDRRRDWLARAGAGLLATAAIAGVGISLAGVGPLQEAKVRSAVDSITQPYSAAEATNSRLTAGLNSGRWDFWVVAWHQFDRAPLIGAGADNFRQQYLLSGKSPENPRYPHSLWLRALGQLGLVGFLLLAGWVLAVAAGVRRLAAGTDPGGRALAVGAGGAFGVWVIHGSADWLLEYGGLSAIVAAMAGLVIAAGPERRARQWRRRVSVDAAAPPTPVAMAAERTDVEPAVADSPAAAADAGDAPVAEPVDPWAAVDAAAAAARAADQWSSAPAGAGAPARPTRGRRFGRAAGGDRAAHGHAARRWGARTVIAAGALLIVANTAWTATQWIAERDRVAAALLAVDQPQRAAERAERAASLEPFGEQADLLLGALAVRRGDMAAAQAAYERAYARNPGATRPRLWLGVLASEAGDRKQAKRWIRRALRTAPRDPIVAGLAAQLKAGQPLDPAAVQALFAGRTAQLIRDPDPGEPDPATTPQPQGAG